MSEPVPRDLDQDRVAFRNYIVEILKAQNVHPVVAINLAGVLADKLAGPVCDCYEVSPRDYDGVQAACPVHGVIVAYNELMREKVQTDRFYEDAMIALANAGQENTHLQAKLEEALRAIFEAGGQHAERMIKMSAAMREQETEIASVKRERHNLKVKLDGVYSDIRALLDGVE